MHNFNVRFRKKNEIYIEEIQALVHRDNMDSLVFTGFLNLEQVFVGYDICADITYSFMIVCRERVRNKNDAGVHLTESEEGHSAEELFCILFHFLSLPLWLSHIINVQIIVKYLIYKS
jgi:hypothetical protein